MFDEGIEHSGGVAAAADRGHDQVGQTAELPARLFDRFAADDRLKIAHDARKRMRSDDRAQNVMRRFDRAHPIAHRFVDGVAQRSRAAGDRPHFGSQQPHAEDIGSLAADVLLAHVDHALQTEAGAGRGRGDAVLAGTGFGDHAVFAHPPGQQHLAERVVDLVRAGVIEILALEVDLGAAGMLAETLGMIEGRRTPHVMLPQVGQLGVEARIGTGSIVLDRQLVERGGERLRHVSAAVIAKTAFCVGYVAAGWHDVCTFEESGGQRFGAARRGRTASAALRDANAHGQRTKNEPDYGLRQFAAARPGNARVARRRPAARGRPPANAAAIPAREPSADQMGRMRLAIDQRQNLRKIDRLIGVGRAMDIERRGRFPMLAKQEPGRDRAAIDRPRTGHSPARHATGEPARPTARAHGRHLPHL